MANVKKDIYLAVKARVLDQVKEIKHFLLFNNQFDRDNEEEAFSYPNAFLEFVQMIWTNSTKQQQEGDVHITLWLGFERYEKESLTVFDTIENVHKALQGDAVGSLFTGLQRIEEQQDTDHDNVIIWKVTYSTQITDCETDTDSGKQQFIIGDNLTINKDLDIDNTVIRTGDGVF